MKQTSRSCCGEGRPKATLNAGKGAGHDEGLSSGPHRQPWADELALLCKALAHPARVRIVEYLELAGNCICGEIVEILPLAQSTVSQHLKILKDCGLIRGEVEGPRTCYCLDRERLARFKELAAALGSCSDMKDS